MIRKVIKLYRPTELLLLLLSIHGSNKSKISRTHTGELNQFLALGDFYLKEVPDDYRGRIVFSFFFVTSKHSRQKI